MIHTGTVHRLKKFYILFLAALFLAFGFSAAFAQESSGSAEPVKKYGLTFPISTLGNCTDLLSCKAYCEDPVHSEACINFAKSKGFYKSSRNQGTARGRLVLDKAKAELGCTGEEDCKAFCKEEVNQDKCREFARKYKLEGEKKAINPAVLEKARAALGCDSEESCKVVCKDPANQEKCSEFARQTGLRGGMIKIPGSVGKNQAGFEQIKMMIDECQKNPGECEDNIATLEAELIKRSDEFCKTNPDKCKDLMKGVKEASRGGKFMPNSDKAFENANPNAKFCRENPEKCRNASASADLKEKSVKPDKIQFKDKVELRDPKVQGVSTSTSIVERIKRFFFN